MYAETTASSLTDNRIQLHYAIQYIAAVGSALATPQPDYSHTTLHWDPTQQLFIGVPIQTRQPFHIALDPVNLILFVLDQGGNTLTQLPLQGKTLEAGLTWLKAEIAKCGADAEKVIFLTYPPDDFPDHAIAHGVPFHLNGVAERKKLTRYYHETDRALGAIAAQTPGASPVHIWPHHFDMATLITVPGETNGEPRSIGVGFSPGDTSYNEPYWYVSPYPYPDRTQLPSLAGQGFWHVHHWTGAILQASQLQTDEQLNLFLQVAIQAAQKLFQ